MKKNEVIHREFNSLDLICRDDFRFRDQNKRRLFSKLTAKKSAFKNNLSFSRYILNDPLPDNISDIANNSGRSGFFKYDQSQFDTIDWHMNFANADVFCGYGGRFFAQDEIQVAEHPALAGLRMAILDEQYNATVSTLASMRCNEEGHPTPILISGAERICMISLEPNISIDLPNGLYGREFSQASFEAIDAASKILNPSTISNFLCIEAPQYGKGIYSETEILDILETVSSGFKAVKLESLRINKNSESVVHTGYWGCGAYGGNRILMTLLQLIAGGWHLDNLVFYYGDDSSSYFRAKEIFESFIGLHTGDAISKIASMEFTWGEGDGN